MAEHGLQMASAALFALKQNMKANGENILMISEYLAGHESFVDATSLLGVFMSFQKCVDNVYSEVDTEIEKSYKKEKN